MTKYEIKNKLEELVTELERTTDAETLWDRKINESIGKLRKHMTHASGNACSCCGGSGVG